MPRSSPSPRPTARPRLASSTNHSSLYDGEMQPSPDQPSSSMQLSKAMCDPHESKLSSTEMHRQDSGYESISPRDPQLSPGATRPRRRPGSTTSGRTGSRTRAPTRRAATSGSTSRRAKTSKLGSRSLMLTQSHPVSVTPSLYSYHDDSPSDARSNTQTSYFHFPPPDPLHHDIAALQGADEQHFDNGFAEEASPYLVPPQTTHYWTSDRTRRLEYAAIDAASRGVKGWIMRHVVPDCFVPKEKRRITFDDDTGSVRRYRLELESEESVTKDAMPMHDVVDRRRKKGRSGAWWP